MTLTHRHLRRWSLSLLVVTGGIGVASVLAWQMLRGSDWNDLFMYLHLGSELGIAAYWNAALLALVAVTSAVSALLTSSGRERRGWLVVAAVALFMSIDEATRLHERTSDWVTYNPLPTYAWIIVGIPLAGLLVLVLWLATRPLPTPLKRGLAVALGIYLLGALVLEALSGVAWRQQRPNLTDALGTMEEMFEMGACILAAHLIARTWLPLRLVPRSRGADQVLQEPVSRERSQEQTQEQSPEPAPLEPALR